MDAVEAMHFQLYKRAKHVYAEARRVPQFRQTCLRLEAGSNVTETLQNLGRLMDELQRSSAELSDSSCPELDQLTQLARQVGAFGSHLLVGVFLYP